jgi:hypothetical protein
MALAPLTRAGFMIMRQFWANAAQTVQDHERALLLESAEAYDCGHAELRRVREAAMMLLPRRRNLMVWSTSAGLADGFGSPRATRTRRIRRCIRTGVLLIIVGLMWPARTARACWQARKQRCELWRELAQYSTPAQRCDLEATFDRYPDSVTYELRDILTRQAIAAFDYRLPAAGRY